MCLRNLRRLPAGLSARLTTSAVGVYDGWVNPIWTQIIFNAVKDVMKVCTHCKKVSAYQQKRVGQFYKCPYCGHKFKERG